MNRKILAWAFYDWANSAFATTVMAGFFPIFLKSYWGQGLAPVITTDYLGSTISYASLFVALISPFLGVIADLRGHKKLFCAIFMIIGVLGCVGLGFLNLGDWPWALTLYAASFISFTASCVFYDSLLPAVSSGHQMDFASSVGYSLGYLGGGILFTINLLMYQQPHWFGISDGIQAVKFSFMSVGLWWLLFSMPLFLIVPEPKAGATRIGLWQMCLNSLRQIQQTILEILKDRNLSLYILSYWLFIDGIYTVMTMAVDFGMSINLQSKDLISALLITQFVGFPATWCFGLLTHKTGCRRPILICLIIYILTVISATQMTQAWHFYALAGVIGLTQGGVQSLSRSMFGKMIPKNKSGEYFAFFNLIGKFASILGPLLVAKGALLTGSPRFGMLGLVILFILGAGILIRVREA